MSNSNLTWIKGEFMADSEEVLNSIKNSKGFFEEIIGDELSDIEIDKLFERSLQEDAISLEDIRDNAPWNRLSEEGDTAYDAFKYYVNLEIDDWEPESILRFVELPDDDVDWWAKEFDWKERRMAYLKYQEWIRRRKAEMKQIENIEDFRDNQAELLKTSSRAAASLVSKLEERISQIEPEEIKVADIPKFISSLSTFLDMASDFEARFNTVNELLALYEDELNSHAIKAHINHNEKEKLTTNGK